MFGKYSGLVTAIVLWALAHPGAALAGPYEDGVAAFRNQDYAVAIELWRPLAEKGDGRAQARMAELYLSGRGVLRNYAEALFWCQQSADQGEARAQYVLASMYRDGRGVKKDPLRAIELFRKAADQDFHWAQYNLGLMYFTGEGGRPDYLKAYHWLSLAANAHDSDDRDDAEVQSTAAFLLDAAAAKLTPEQIADAKQRIDEWKPTPTR
jgi:TPR repeat protein